LTRTIVEKSALISKPTSASCSEISAQCRLTHCHTLHKPSQTERTERRS